MIKWWRQLAIDHNVFSVSHRSLDGYFPRRRSCKFILLHIAYPCNLQHTQQKVYKAYLHSTPLVPVLLKHRFNKQYRHPTLDASLTKSRVAGEARALMKCLRYTTYRISYNFLISRYRSGVSVPGIRMVDAPGGVLGIEWIEGTSVRMLLGGGAEDEQEAEILEYAADTDDDEPQEEEVDSLLEYEITLGTRMFRCTSIDADYLVR